VIGDERVTKVRFEGSIPKNGTLCSISGFVGIGDVHSTQCNFNDALDFFSRSVKVSYVPGSLELINICADLFLQESSGLTVQQVYPQPAMDNVNIQVQALTNENLIIKMIDHMGKEQLSAKYPIFAGEQLIDLSLPSTLHSGVYTLTFCTEHKGILSTKSIHVIR
jgi:hypothetical protein